MEASELLRYADMLLKTAIAKTHNTEEAEDLVQETYLCALNAIAKGAEIENPKAYLSSILQNQFFMSLRKKYKVTTVSFEEMPVEIADNEDAFAGIFYTDEAKAIRRELAFLTYIYREVMVRYYMHSQSVEQIAKALNIPKGTVLSRLDAGRNKVKKGVEQMKSYTQNSYQPEILTIGISGRTGRNEEPFSCVKSSMEQNILILAYEKPLAIEELSDGLGVQAAFIEDTVDKLVNAQLMKKEGVKVYTDFLITSLKDHLDALDASKKFADDTFDKIKEVFADSVAQYRKMKGFSAFNDTQLYILAVLSAQNIFFGDLLKAAIGKSKPFDEFPDRPNYGKWYAMGSRYPSGYQTDHSELKKYGVSGKCSLDDINENIIKFEEWDTDIGHTHNAIFKYFLSINERAKLLDAVRCDCVNAFQAELIPDLIKYGFVKDVNGKKELAIPVLTNDEFKEMRAINGRQAEKLKELLMDEAVETIKKNVLRYPKHIKDVSDTVYTISLQGLPMAYVYCAQQQGLIEIDENKSYPVMYMILR